MKRIWTAVPLVVATMLLTGCGSVDGVGPDRVASGTTGSAAAPDGRALPDWHPPLPSGHPPITTGPMHLPPGHPAVPEGFDTCPGGGSVREPDTGRVRDFEADPNEVIRI
jgi:predicted small secreted protein